MKNQDLAKRKIEEKRSLRKAFQEEYRRLTSGVPDIRRMSSVPAAEEQAAKVGRIRRAGRIEAEERNRVRSVEELTAAIENYDRKRAESRPIFTTKTDRYRWLVDCLALGKPVSEEDSAFMAEFEAGMTDGGRRRWQVYRESVAAGPAAAGGK